MQNLSIDANEWMRDHLLILPKEVPMGMEGSS
jgi:hypothetical protein